VKEGRFREDLYYRLNVVNVCIPPLRERREEVPVLVDHFRQLYSAKYGRELASISDRLMRGFVDYAWPGNVRELENMVKRIVVLQSEDAIADEIFGATASASAARLAPAQSAAAAVESADRSAIPISLRDIGRRPPGRGARGPSSGSSTRLTGIARRLPDPGGVLQDAAPEDQGVRPGRVSWGGSPRNIRAAVTRFP
jgi:hypothetical protein